MTDKDGCSPGILDSDILAALSMTMGIQKSEEVHHVRDTIVRIRIDTIEFIINQLEEQKQKLQELIK